MTEPNTAGQFPTMNERTASSASGVDQTMEAAVAHHRAGRIAEAEQLYLEALEREPKLWRALHNLGLLYLDRKEPARALPLLARAMEAENAGPDTWMAYARALINNGRFEEAERLVGTHAEHPRARAVELRLRQAWGMAAVKGRALVEAESQFRKALALAPDDPDALGDLGFALLSKGETASAESYLRQALKRSPDNTGILQNLGSALYRQGRTEEAAEHYWRAIRLNPADSQAAQNLGILLTDVGAGDEGLALAELVQPHQPRLAALIRADSLMNLGRYDESAAILDELDAAIPGDPAVLYRRGFIRLTLCDFKGGWQDYESRWRVDSFVKDSAAPASQPFIPVLDVAATPKSLARRRVLVVGEQGIGDQIMFASIIPDLARTAAEVTFLTEKRLCALFANSFPDVQVTPLVEANVSAADYDKVIALGSLGRIFRNRSQAFPGEPYLRPREEAVRRWDKKLGRRPKALRIGVSWRGGTKKTRAGQRSITLERLRPVLDLPGCEFVNLQYGDVAAEIAAFNAGRDNPIRFFPPAETNDFEELAALLEGLDAVVSVQTAVVHLCGAIGKECLTLIPARPEWRYTARAKRLPWYRSVRLFRQAEGDDWDNVVARVADDLRARIG